LLHFAGSSHPDDQVILRVDQHARIASSWKAPDDNVSWFRSVKAREQETFDDILGPPLQPTAVASKIGHLWWSPLPRALFGGLRGLEHASMSRRILLFFNNGMESLVSTTTPIEVTEINGYSQLDDARKAGVEIYALGVFPSDAESVVSGYSTAFKPKAEPSALEKLASDTGGMAAVVDSEDSLMQAVDRIAREIRGAYTLAFESPTKDKQFHRVRVEITGPDTYTVRARPGYMAAK
jgi:VWFA-related protein